MAGFFDGNGFFKDLLGEVPEAAYFSQPFRPGGTQGFLDPQSGASGNQRVAFQNAFRDIHNQYLGALGTQIRSGQSPNLQFTDFLAQQRPFTERLASTAPSLRFGGGRSSQFAPRTRSLFNF